MHISVLFLFKGNAFAIYIVVSLPDSWSAALWDSPWMLILQLCTQEPWAVLQSLASELFSRMERQQTNTRMLLTGH